MNDPILENEPERTRMDIRPGLVGSAILLAVAMGFSLYGWQHIAADAKLPMHWNARGEVDGWGGRTQALVLFPAIIAGLSALMAFIPMIEPRAGNLAKSQKAYTAIWLSTTGMMAALHVAMVSNALGSQIDINTVVLVGVGALFMVIGNFLGKIQSNYFCGIRTPWTLSSELSWRKTHRFSRWIFVAQGLAFWLLAGFGISPTGLFCVVGFTLLGVPAMLVYSYIVWKHDPARVARAQ